MKLKPATFLQLTDIELALKSLRLARAYLVRAQCPQATDAVRRALKSVEGAQRHAERRFAATRADIIARSTFTPALSCDQVADAEGWGVFNDGEIQRDDEANKFASDADALAHVKARAAAGSAPHHEALQRCGVVS